MNCKTKALIIINEAVQYEVFKNYFESSTKVECDVKKLNGIEAKEYIKINNDRYDVIIVDVQLPERDGISIINELYNEGCQNKYFLVSEYNTVFLKKITSIVPSIEAVFINPKEMKDIEDAILICNGYQEKKIETENDVEIKAIISKQLHKLGMPAHIKGYQYIREGIFQMFTNKGNVSKITKELYPLIAEKYDTTPSRVERAIRHSIEVSWSRGDYEVMESIFGNSVDFERSKPTNSEFISSVADAIILETKLKNADRVRQLSYN